MRSNHIQRPDDAVISKAANAAYRTNYDLIFGNRESRMPHLGGNRDWTEDNAHENGNYECICHACHQHFIGHKRRVVCKVCASK